mgnify:CR=1 FL=1
MYLKLKLNNIKLYKLFHKIKKKLSSIIIGMNHVIKKLLKLKKITEK